MVRSERNLGSKTVDSLHPAWTPVLVPRGRMTGGRKASGRAPGQFI